MCAHSIVLVLSADDLARVNALRPWIEEQAAGISETAVSGIDATVERKLSAEVIEQLQANAAQQASARPVARDTKRRYTL